MRIKIMTLVGLTIGAISTGLAVAEESSVAGVMADLKEVAGSASVGAPAVAVPAAVVVEPVAAEPLDVEAAIEESREYYVAADYLRARQGFESVLAKEHGNPVARYYLKKMNERQQRKAEQTAMDAVESSWNGMVFRDYSLSADAVKTMGVSEADEAVDVSPEFPEVDFPEGAYATYRPSLSRLF
ncbi:MAG: hypothetical protein JEZ10_06965, partial [Verrucomicrobia bacterium]|nr:hypothetical protein [Verrucomicrobiota bacterium]